MRGLPGQIVTKSTTNKLMNERLLSLMLASSRTLVLWCLFSLACILSRPAEFFDLNGVFCNFISLHLDLVIIIRLLLIKIAFTDSYV